MYYKLVDKKPVKCDMMDWAFSIENREQEVVGKTTIGAAQISTVFLGLDHSMGFVPKKEHVPILFETMVFGGKHDHYCDRYATWAEAEAGHKEVCEMVGRSLTLPEYIKQKVLELFHMVVGR